MLVAMDEETLEILSDPSLLADIREAEQERAAGKAVTLTKDDALALIRNR
jgi:hypothetical protein